MAIKTNMDMGGADPVREEEFSLPSAGIPYLDKHADFPEVVKVRPFSFITEGLLTSHKDWNEKMAAIAEKVVATGENGFPEDFNFENLLIGDLFFILACSRGLTYGEVYKFNTQCPSCKVNETHEMAIPRQLPVHTWHRKDSIKVKKGEDANSQENREKRGGSLVDAKFLTVELPTVKDDIELKFLSLKEDMELSKRFKQMEKLGSRDSESQAKIARIAAHIKTVNGTTADNGVEMEEYITRIVGDDMVMLTEAIQEKAPGIVFNGLVNCDECGYRYPFDLPLSSHFFRRNRV